MSHVSSSNTTPGWFPTMCSTFLGALLESVTGQLLYNMTKQLQNIDHHKKIDLRPRALYNGALVAAPIVGGITLLQKSADKAINSIFFQYMEERLVRWRNLQCHFLQVLYYSPFLKHYGSTNDYKTKDDV